MNEIFEIIKSFNDDYIELYEPLSDKEIEELLLSLKAKLPNDFLTFLKFSNGITIDGDEVLGFKNKRNDIISVYNREHDEVKYPMFNYIYPFSPDGRGNYYCFDIKSNNIIFWVSNYTYDDKNKPEVVYKSFEEWFKEVMIVWVIENNDSDLFKNGNNH